VDKKIVFQSGFKSFLRGQLTNQAQFSLIKDVNLIRQQTTMRPEKD